MASREAKGLDGARFLCDALEAAKVAVFGFDMTGQLAIVNKTGELLTGYAADELLGTDPLERLFGDRADMIRRLWFGADANLPVEMEVPLQTSGELERVVWWHAASHIPPDEEFPMLVVVGIDATRQRELERHMRRNERLATADVLAAGLAHEIRNPLNGASLHLSILERALSRVPNVPSAAVDAIAVLRTETRRLSTLMTDFLEVARPRKLARFACELNEIARGIAALVERESDARAVPLKFEPYPEALVAEVDAECIRRALVNLVDNAVDATAGCGNIVLRIRRTAHFAEIDVEDDGPGIANPNAPIFDAFYTTKQRGTGLGLSIVQRVASDHGGEVVYTSQPGRTVFTLRFPIVGYAA